MLGACTLHARPSVGASVRVAPALERHLRLRRAAAGHSQPCYPPSLLLMRIRARAVVTRGAASGAFAVTCHSCTAALVTWYRVSLCVRSSDRGGSRSAERRARMVVVCLGPFPIPRIAVRQLGVSTFVLLYCYTYCYRCLPSYWQLLLEGPHSQKIITAWSQPSEWWARGRGA